MAAPLVRSFAIAALFAALVNCAAHAGSANPSTGTPGAAQESSDPLGLVPSPTNTLLRTLGPDCCNNYNYSSPVTGTIRDAATGLPIANAAVTLTDGLYLQGTTSTDGSGNYVFWSASGPLTLVAGAPGYRSAAAGLSGGCTVCDWGSCPTIPISLSLEKNACAAWLADRAMPTARAAAVAVASGGGVYVLGGANAAGIVATNEHYDPSGNTWAACASLPTPRAGFAAGLLNGSVYVAGGLNGAGAVNSTSRYDTGSNTWAGDGSEADMPHPGWGVAGAVLNGKLWVSGGYNGTEYDVTWLRAYDPATQAWSTFASMANKRSWHAMAALNGKLFVFGGTYDPYAPWGSPGPGVTLSSVEIYDPITDTWSAGPPMPQGLINVSAVGDPVNNRIVVVGGSSGSASYSSEAAYNTVMQLRVAPTTSGYEWAYLNGSPESGIGTAIAIAGGRVRLFGGRTAMSTQYSTGAWHAWQSDVVNLAGTARDEVTGAAIPGATVRVFSAGRLWASRTADAGAAWAAAALPSGTYLLEADAAGYGASTSSRSYVCGVDATANLALHRDAGVSWQTLQSMSTARAGACAVNLGGKIHVIGGAGTSGVVAQNTYFDPASGSWIALMPMTTARSQFAASALLGRIFVAGGVSSTAGTPVATTEMYDPATNSWTRMADMLYPAWGAAGSVVHGLYDRWYVSGGYSTNPYDTYLSSYIRVYDPLLGTWGSTYGMPRPRARHSSALIDGKLFLIGGASANEPAGILSVDVLDPATGTWTQGPPLPFPLMDATAASDEAAHKITVVGGVSANGLPGQESYYAVVLELAPSPDPTGYRWSFRCCYPVAAAGIATALGSNQYVYAFGGRTSAGSDFLADARALPPGATPDFVVDEIRVAQAVESMRQVKNKKTVARAYFHNAGAALAGNTTLRGRLHVGRPGGAELFTLDNANVVTCHTDGNFTESERLAGDNTLNFYLDPAKGQVSESALEFWVELDPANEIAESNEGNNIGPSPRPTQWFTDGGRIRIAYCMMSPDGKPFSAAGLQDSWRIMAATYPVLFDKDADWIAIQPTIGWFWAETWATYGRATANKLNGILGKFNRDRRKAGKPECDRIVGFVKGPCDGSLGYYVNGVTKAVSIMANCKLVNGRGFFQQDLAHELGHSYGLRGEYYDPCQLTDFDCDAKRQLIASDNFASNWFDQACLQSADPCANLPARNKDEGAFYGRFVSLQAFDPEAGRPAAWAPAPWSELSPSHVKGRCAPLAGCSAMIADVGARVPDTRRFGFMSKSDLGDQTAWITDGEYEGLCSRLLPSPSRPLAAQLPPAARTAETPYLAVRFLLTGDNTVYPFEWETSPDSIADGPPPGSAYAIEFRDAAGQVLASHPFGSALASGDTTIIAADLPLPAAAAEIRVLRDGVPLYSRTVSGHPPVVALLEPAPGVSLNGPVTIRWSATDEDGDSLVSSVYLSLDAGLTWNPLLLSSRGTSYSWEASGVAASDSAELRVVVTDGVHASDATSAAGFSVAASPPRASISGPADSARVLAGRPFLASGTLTSPDAGAGLSDSLAWFADSPVALGRGSSLLVPALPPGPHLLIASGRDPHGVTAADTVTVFVLADTDGDGMPDEWESLYPALAYDIPDGALDADADSLANADEYLHGTNPMNPDTDGDGFADGYEVAHGSDPLSASSLPNVSVASPRGPLVASVLQYPNPFRCRVAVRFTIPRDGEASVSVYDLAGRLITELAHGMRAPGTYELMWDGLGRTGNRSPAGIYFVRLRTAGVDAVSRAVMLQ